MQSFVWQMKMSSRRYKCKRKYTFISFCHCTRFTVNDTQFQCVLERLKHASHQIHLLTFRYRLHLILVWMKIYRKNKNVSMNRRTWFLIDQLIFNHTYMTHELINFFVDDDIDATHQTTVTDQMLFRYSIISTNIPQFNCDRR